jgi:hypothetical protein
VIDRNNHDATGSDSVIDAVRKTTHRRFPDIIIDDRVSLGGLTDFIESVLDRLGE